MGACAQLKQGQIFDCDSGINPGFETEFAVLDYENLGAYAVDGTNKQLLTSLAKSTGQAWSFVVPKDSSLTSSVETTEGAYINSVTQSITFPVIAKNPDDIDNLQRSINNKFIIVLKKKDKGATGNFKYHVYGFQGGGKIILSLTDQAGGDDTSGVYLLTFEAINHKLPMIYFDTDESTTDAGYVALKTP